MKSVTIDQVMSWNPCNPPYTREYVTKLFGRRKTLTALQILDLKIPVGDRLWAVLRPELIDDRTLRLFACDCAERALKRDRKIGREPDKRLWDAIKVARKFAYGKATKEKLAAARAAGVAWAAGAAWAAARDAERKWQLQHLRKMLEK